MAPMSISVVTHSAHHGVTLCGVGLTLAGTPLTTLTATEPIFAGYGVDDVVVIGGVGPTYGTDNLRAPLVTTIAAKISSSAVTLADAGSRGLINDDTVVITLGKDPTAALVAAHAAAAGGLRHGTPARARRSPGAGPGRASIRRDPG
jgi:hypothetical protein